MTVKEREGEKEGKERGRERESWESVFDNGQKLVL